MFDEKSWIIQNLKGIDCNTLQNMSTAAMLASIAAGDTIGDAAATAFKAVEVALDMAWAVQGCENDPPEWPDDPMWRAGAECSCVTGGGNGIFQVVSWDGQRQYSFGQPGDVQQVLGYDDMPNGDYIVSYIDKGGARHSEQVVIEKTGVPDAYIEPTKGNYCCDQIPDYPKPPLDEPIGPILEHEEEECKIEIEPVTSYVDKFGTYWSKYNVRHYPSTCGRDYFFWSSDQGPYFCNPEDYECPPPNPRGGEGGSNNDVSVDEKTYTLFQPCPDSLDPFFKNPEEWKVAGGQANLPVIERLDAISDMLGIMHMTASLTCTSKKDEKGDWVTIQWISDEASSDSQLRLRKRTRYRSESSRSDDELIAYHQGFTWEAGPVCVRHVGEWWGEPQVWAKDANEGKRVIRHLAGEAGIDPDKDGRWAVAGARNPRFGRSGTMRVRKIEGFPWISSRDGSNMLPMGQCLDC